ncbi:ABC transporter permease [Paeniglutamicibacter kerguelensis]|uniref:NitT/TauT family transport system permease protein n=1 Tax=Paeniglutamicibacter kerguelensis TaxID=254788 RepID=A0ABS4XDE0_9MICC|nr:ABC transporter permease [Paeniglutamicibacter kerguelensis]MBP2386386.1 NitT/TauT family transport system permease protein [Paeniglutamicibacter kerguelensis]
MPTSPGATATATAAIDNLKELEAGLDNLQEGPAPVRRSASSRVLLPLGTILGLLSLWQLAAWFASPRADLFPGPVEVFGTAAGLAADGRLAEAALTSLQRGVLGFLLALGIGTPLGLLLSASPTLRRGVGPLVSGLQVLPSVAWVPAAIIWFGLTDATVYFVVVMGATPSIINGLLSGVDTVPPQYRRLGTVLGASRAQGLLRIVLPAALPGYLAGLKQGWAFSWRSLMAAEIIAVGGSIGFGLGSLLQQGRDLSSMAVVACAILAILVVGIVIELLVFAPLERRLLRRRGLAPRAGR